MCTQARAIHRVAIASIPPLLHEVLEAAHLELHDIDWVIPASNVGACDSKGHGRSE